MRRFLWFTVYKETEDRLLWACYEKRQLSGKGYKIWTTIGRKTKKKRDWRYHGMDRAKD